MRNFCLAGLLIAALAGPALAESRDEMALRMQAAEAAARAATTLPTDEAMTCEQVRAELAAIAQQPAYRAQRQLAAESQAAAVQSGAYAYVGIPGGAGLEFAGAFAPGLGYAHMAALHAQSGQVRRNAEANAMQAAAINESALAHIARSERLQALSHAKACEPQADLNLERRHPLPVATSP